MAARRSVLNFAGNIFGFSPDVVSEAEKDSVLTDMFPELKLVQATKPTRGGRLGRQKTPFSAELTMKQALPSTTVNVTTTVPTPTPTPPAKIFQGRVGTATIEEIGQKGFGMKDYSAAIEAGYSPESIKDYVIRNKDTLYNIGPEAQKVLGLTGYVSTTPGVFNYGEYGGAGFGMKDINALETRGVVKSDLLKLAKQASTVGPEAQKYLGIAGSPTDWNYAAFGKEGFGSRDLNAALAQGFSGEQIKSIAEKAPGGKVGPKVQEYIKSFLPQSSSTPAPAPTPAPTPTPTPTPAAESTPEWEYSKYGLAGFGGEDLSAALAQGYSPRQISTFAKKAPGGQVGPKVTEFLKLYGY